MGTTLSPRGADAVARPEAREEPVASFDRDWCIRSVSPALARLLGRTVAELVGRTIWVALPELGGTIFHSFLLRARSTGTPVTWSGFYPPAGRWLEATAVVEDDLLQVTARVVAGGRAGHLADAAAARQPGEGADRLRFLAEVSETLIATLDTGEAATRLAEVATRRLCDWAFVALRGEDGRLGEDAWAHRDPARRADLQTYLTGRLRDAGDAVLHKALLSGAPVQMTTMDPARVAPTLPTEEVRAAWRRLGTTSCLIVPLRARGETFGAMALLNAGDRPPHSEMEIATAVEVARRGALALDNARLYGRQLTVAVTLQHSLLTPPPRPEGLQVAVRYRPAAAHQQVGGDWYDAFTRPDGATLLVIGDVVGHNVAAAAAMGQIRSMLRAIAFDRAESPARVLTRVDAVLAGLRVGTLATTLVAHVEPPHPADGACTLHWSSAGHLPPLLAHPAGTVDVLDRPPERLLGTDAPGPHTDHEARLCPGDTLLLYTDGLVEHGRRVLDDGIAELTDVLGGLATLPLDRLCDRLLDRLVTGGTDDDIALLAVRCHPRDGGPAG
ncbi:SpoIIE family protein phosphatase [Geodermatophilus sp. SYSU D01186]